MEVVFVSKIDNKPKLTEEEFPSLESIPRQPTIESDTIKSRFYEYSFAPTVQLLYTHTPTNEKCYHQCYIEFPSSYSP